MALSSTPESVLIIADSHGKCLKSDTFTSHYQIHTYSTSGLQWINHYNPKLSLMSLIHEEPYISLLNSVSYVLFFVATNSVRCLPATKIIDQIDQMINLLYSRHSNLRNGKIIVMSCMPCFKTTKRFPTYSLLTHNIDCYNRLLYQLSYKLNIIYFDLQVPDTWLSHDLMHIGQQYQQCFSNILLAFIDSMPIKQYANDQV